MAKKEKESETFPKIAAEAKLKKIVICDKTKLEFEDLQFSPDQYAQLERWRKNNDIIHITLEQVQGDLGMSK
jgi:hypothetical protein